jgi:hypothetical protein
MSLLGMAVSVSTESIPVDVEWQADKFGSPLLFRYKAAYHL